jgi:TRAP-type C4-dicarboxylate transport system permease small subunit
MHHTVRRIAHLFTRVFANGASFSMIVLFLIVFINSVRRYTVGKSLEWGEELPVFIAIYGIMFGVAWAYMEDRHIRFTMLIGFLSERLNRLLYIVVDLIMVATGAVLTYSGWLFVIKRGGIEASGLINLAKSLKAMTGWDGMIWIGHLYPYQAAMVIGGGMLTIAAFLKLFMRFDTSEQHTTIVEVK